MQFDACVPCSFMFQGEGYYFPRLWRGRGGEEEEGGERQRGRGMASASPMFYETRYSHGLFTRNDDTGMKVARSAQDAGEGKGTGGGGVCPCDLLDD